MSMLADAKVHKFDIILCKSQSRFIREMELIEKYIHGPFPACGIRFVSVVDNALIPRTWEIKRQDRSMNW